MPAPPNSTTPLTGAEGLVAKWKRWPCHRCGHEGRAISLECPECDALPWDERASPRSSGPRTGTDIEVRSRGVVRRHYRFSTPSGFLGVLSRRFRGGGDWLGVDGSEWRIDRVGLLGFTYILREGSNPQAGAEAPSFMGGIFRGDFRLLEGGNIWRFHRTGLTRHAFLLALEDGPEVARISGSLLDPLRRIEVLEETPLPILVLGAFLACGLRQGESGEVV